MNFSVRTLMAVALLPLMQGFVLMRAGAPRLPVTAENGVASFVWDGSVPPISGRDEYRAGAYVDVSAEELMKAIIQHAMDRWNSVPGSYLRMIMEEGASSIDSEDRVNSIMIKDDNNGSSAASATPHILTDEESGKPVIADCDIAVSPNKTSAKNLERTIAHELGHCLGLGHSHTNYKSLMGYSRDDHSSALGLDDMAGVVYLYPDAKTSSKRETEMISLDQCGVLAGSEHERAVSASLSLFCLLFPLCMICGRRPGRYIWSILLQ